MTTIRLPRPDADDPVSRAAWDEARQACEDRPKLELIIDDETRPVWECALRAAVEVAAWPEWKRNEQPASEAIAQRDVKPGNIDPDCCVGDRSRCRCAPERGGWSDEDVEREKWRAVWGDETETVDE